MVGHSRHSACKHRTMAASGVLCHPAYPLSLPGGNQSSAQPAGDSHSLSWGRQPPGTRTNLSLQQMLPVQNKG